MASAESVRAGAPARSIAASRTSAFITVPSMPSASPVARETPRAEISTPRNMLPPPITTPSEVPSRPPADQTRRQPIDRRLPNTKTLIPGESLARQFEDHASIGRLRHGPKLRPLDLAARCRASPAFQPSRGVGSEQLRTAGVGSFRFTPARVLRTLADLLPGEVGGAAL